MTEKAFSNLSIASGHGDVMSGRCAKDTDAALSLCALGHLIIRNESPALTGRPMSIELPSSTMLDSAKVVTPIITRSPAVQRVAREVAPRLSTLSMAHSPQPLNELGKYNIFDLLPKKQQGATQKTAIVKATSQRKNNMKPKDPKRDTTVSFEEMKRLMRVYGPIKALRNRASKDIGKSAKPESIRRKFYRWFPDFHERFVKTADGWFTPKAGHQQEMQYREDMRKIDQEILVKKRNDKRYNYAIIGNKTPTFYY